MSRHTSQSRCAWNDERFVQVTSERDHPPDWRKARDRPDGPADLPGTESPSFVELMLMMREEWDRWTRGSRSTASACSGGSLLSADPREDMSGDSLGRRRAHPGTEAPSLVELMRMTREEWDAFSRGSAIRRAGYAGFKRNVAVALGNWLASVEEAPEEAVAVLRGAVGDDDPLVREHAAWALERA